MKKITLAVLLACASHGASANEPINAINNGLCLELKADGISKPCNSDMMLDDDGQGKVQLMSGYAPSPTGKRMIFNIQAAQSPDMENAYGYAFRVNGVTLMTKDEPGTKTFYNASGLCYMVKPNPVKVGKKDVKQDIVFMCSAKLAENAPLKKIDWKFVY